MDPAIDLAPTPGLNFNVRQVAFVLAALFVITIGGLWAFDAAERIDAGELIWPTPANVWTGVVFLTAFLVILGAIRILARGNDLATSGERRGNPVDALIAGPILLLIAISAAARVGVQIIGFAGLHPAPFPVMFTVVATTHGRSRGGTDYYRLRLRYSGAGRTFSDPVDRLVYEAARDGDTVALPVETGRFGLQRAMVATPLLPADLHHPG